MNWLWAFICSAALFSPIFAQSRGFYTIVGPKVFRPNSEYHAAVTVEGVAQPTTVIVELGGKQDSGGVFRASQFVTAEPYVTRIVRLEIGDVGPGMYNLTVRGEGGLNFYNSTALNFIHKSYSVFIQTDKAIYKPGHKVMFRTLVLNSHLKPSVTGTIDIHITDGAGNRVKQWARVLTTRGVFSGEFQLSENPVMGDWTITVNVLDQIFTKSFQVAEYVLPKFEVSVDIPKHATFKDSVIVGTVRSKYTYGRPVKGEATITVYPSYYSDVIQPIFQNPVRKVVPIDGKAHVEIDIVKELQLTDEYERVVQVDVTVEEALTGRRQNTTAQVMLHKHKYKMDLIKTSEYFKPGLKYSAFIKLSHHDGTPVIDKTNPVKVRTGYSYASEEYTESEYKLSSNGIIDLVFYPPANNVTTLGIEAEYLDLKEWFSTVSAAVSPSNSFIQTVVRTENPKVNDDVEMEVNSTAPLKYLSYQVLGRGDVIVANTVRVNPGARTAAWRFLATYAMAPTAHVIVHYVRDDGEVVADAIDIELEGVLQNYVKLDATPTEVEPGSPVDIKMEAKPNSYIGLLGVDQSVLLLKSGNDITEDDVLSELRSYDAGDSPMYHVMRGLREKRSFAWWPGSFTAHQAFDKSGAIILTNGYVHEHTPWMYFRGNFPEEDLAYAAFSPEAVSSAGGGGAVEQIRIRSKFPETWIWEMIDSGYDGRTSVRRPVPDTITSWVLSAFSIDPLYGFGLIEAPRKVKVFRPFFVSLDLPYSIIRGETVSIPVVVFNYMNKEVTADVTLENKGEFDFADYSNDVYEQPKLELFRRKRVTIAPNSGSTTSFMITPKQIGYITIKVEARSPIAGDAVERKLLVKAEGETQYINKAIFVDLRNTNRFEKNVTLTIPPNFVPDSEYTEVSAVGDILGSAITNLGHLIKMPFGCGEQNMLNLVPNIVILDYLKNSRQLTPAVESKALRFLETGYQQELTYKRSDGSFSAFGNADPMGSTWLTAFVVKSFRQAMPYITVEEKVILDGLEWLAEHQAPNGSFPEVGQVSHTDMQGGAGHGLALTAYTLIAFVENRGATQKFSNTINKAIDYIVRHLDGLDDIYALAVSTYALHLAQHPSKEYAFNQLNTKFRSSDSASSMKWLMRPQRASDDKNPNAWGPSSVNVEMTAYGLLTFLNRGLIEDSFPIMKWLISQQNDEGGFASTQDTVLALTALSKLASVITSPSQDVSVTFSYGKGVTTDIRVNSANAMILQKKEISKKARDVEIKGTGSGFAIVQISYKFNVNVTGPWPLFTLDPQVDRNSDKNRLQLSICSGFAGERDGPEESNMAVMEVALPSGFTADLEALPSLQLSNEVKRVETKEGDTVVVLYFDKMTKKEVCPTVSAFRTHKVAKQRPVPVTLYDYYDQSRRARVFYEARTATVCDICEGEDCRVCSGKIGSQSGDPDKGSSTMAQLSIISLLISFYLGRAL